MRFLVVLSYWVEAQDADLALDAAEDHVRDLKEPGTEATLSTYTGRHARSFRGMLESEGSHA